MVVSLPGRTVSQLPKLTLINVGFRALQPPRLHFFRQNSPAGLQENSFSEVIMHPLTTKSEDIRSLLPLSRHSKIYFLAPPKTRLPLESMGAIDGNRHGKDFQFC